MHNKTVLRDDDRWREAGKGRRVNCAVDTSWKYAVDKVAITFSSLSTYAFWARRARATCATGVILGQKRVRCTDRGERRVTGVPLPPSPLQTIPFSFPWTWTNTWDTFSLSLWRKWRRRGGKGLPRGRGDSPHFFELTTPLRRNFFSAFFTFFTPPSSRKRRFARKSLIIEEISVDSRATL